MSHFVYSLKARRYTRALDDDITKPPSSPHIFAPVEVAVHVPTYNRYNRLREHWCDLKSGAKVLCHTRKHHPEGFYDTGHGKPLSCGRVTTNPVGAWWRNDAVGGTGEWRCPQCNLNAALKVGSITGDL